MIERNAYIKLLGKYKDKKLIKVITGLRRSGKSTLMMLFQKKLMESGVDAHQIISINFEDFDYFDLLDAKALYAYIKPKVEVIHREGKRARRKTPGCTVSHLGRRPGTKTGSPHRKGGEIAGYHRAYGNESHRR